MTTTESKRIAELEGLLREWQGDYPGDVCGCGRWLGTDTPQERKQHPPCLHCRTRVALDDDASSHARG